MSDAAQCFALTVVGSLGFWLLLVFGALNLWCALDEDSPPNTHGRWATFLMGVGFFALSAYALWLMWVNFNA